MSLPLVCSGFTLLSISSRNVATVLASFSARVARTACQVLTATPATSRTTSALAVAKPNRWRRMNLPSAIEGARRGCA